MNGRARARLGVAVVGCGYWGPNLVRNFQRHPACQVRTVVDVRQERAASVAREHHVRVATENLQVALQDRSIDLVVIASPTRWHYSLALQALRAGKHVLVMKPMTDSVAHAEELIDVAQQQGVLLAVDHTFVYSGAVRKLQELVTDGSLGDLYYIDSVRINLGLFQSDVNVIWDLAPHDVSIIDHLLGGVLPREVTAIGAAHAGSRHENVAYVTLRYGENLLAHIHVNWLAPAKVRRTIVGGSRRMVLYDDTHQSEKLMVYDKGVTIDRNAGGGPGSGSSTPYEQLVSYRAGDMTAPHLDDREALAFEVDHLVTCLRTGMTPDADGQAGLRAVQILEAAQRSLDHGSSVVRLGTERIVPAALEAPRPAADGQRPVIAIPVVPQLGVAATARSHG